MRFWILDRAGQDIMVIAGPFADYNDADIWSTRNRAVLRDRFVVEVPKDADYLLPRRSTCEIVRGPDTLPDCWAHQLHEWRLRNGAGRPPHPILPASSAEVQKYASPYGIQDEDGAWGYN